MNEKQGESYDVYDLGGISGCAILRGILRLINKTLGLNFLPM